MDAVTVTKLRVALDWSLTVFRMAVLRSSKQGEDKRRLFYYLLSTAPKHVVADLDAIERAAFERLVKRRWTHLSCSCGEAFVMDATHRRLRCPKCRVPHHLLDGTLATGFRLSAATWVQAAEVFASHRHGISVHVLASKAETSLQTAHRLMTMFRRALEKIDYHASSRHVLLLEVEIGRRVFKKSPDAAPQKDRWSVLVVCGIELSGAHLQSIASCHVRSLHGIAPEKLATLLAQEVSQAQTVYVFQGSRLSSLALAEARRELDLPSFLKDRLRAGGALKKRLADLRHLVVTVPHGKLQGKAASVLLDEFNFRQECRGLHTREIADRLLERVLTPSDFDAGPALSQGRHSPAPAKPIASTTKKDSSATFAWDKT